MPCKNREWTTVYREERSLTSGLNVSLVRSHAAMPVTNTCAREKEWESGEWRERERESEGEGKTLVSR